MARLMEDTAEEALLSQAGAKIDISHPWALTLALLLTYVCRGSGQKTRNK